MDINFVSRLKNDDLVIYEGHPHRAIVVRGTEIIGTYEVGHHKEGDTVFMYPKMGDK